MYLFILVFLLFLGIYWEMEFLGDIVVLFFFLRKLYIVFHSDAALICNFHQQCYEGSLFPHSLSNICYL